MRVKILSEGGTWTILDCEDLITDEMTGTQLLKYIQAVLRRRCPNEARDHEFKIRLEMLT